MSAPASLAQALLYLRVTSLVGWIRSRLKRLRQPKYLAGAVVGAGWIYLLFLRRAAHAPGVARGGRPPPEIPPEVLGIFTELGALALLLGVLVNWVIPRRAALAFSEAEIAFLFPAPVSRRMLVHYRLLGTQLGIAVTALVLTLVFGRFRTFGEHRVFQAVGWWLVLATLNLHTTGTSFVYSRLLNRSITTHRRRLAVLGIVVLFALLVSVWASLTLRLPQPGDLVSFTTLVGYIGTQLHSGPVPWLLAIPKALMAPALADSTREFVLALGPALAVFVAHYFWVVRTEVAFEEASIARAEKHAARLRAVRQGDWRGPASARKARRPAFTLRPVGRPEVAFLWKNLLATSGFFRPKVALALFGITVAGSYWLAHEPRLEFIRLWVVAMFGILLAATVLLGPMMARQDLRLDLLNADILKTYPLRGWQVVLGELLTPAAILTSLAWLSLIAGYLLLPTEQLTWFSPALRGAVALGLAILAPSFVIIQLLAPNAAAVIFPAWAQATGNAAERGIEVLGQRIIFSTGQLLVTALATVPAAVTGAVLFFLTQWLIGPAGAVLVASIGMSLLLAAEAWWSIRWLGVRFERFDLSAELQP